MEATRVAASDVQLSEGLSQKDKIRGEDLFGCNENLSVNGKKGVVFQ